eukprot:11198560-Lingulodinium_polyedra.AAC.1
MPGRSSLAGSTAGSILPSNAESTIGSTVDSSVESTIEPCVQSIHTGTRCTVSLQSRPLHYQPTRIDAFSH